MTEINFTNFVKVSKKFYRNYKQINKIKKEITSLVNGYGINVWKNYTFEVGKLNGEFTTDNIKMFEEILGCEFDFGGKTYTKYIIENNGKGNEKIVELKNLIFEQKKLAQHIKDMSATQFPQAIICGKRRNLETFTNSCWGFRVREINKELNLEDIINIEKETGSIFVERNTYGCDFQFKI